MNTSVQAIHCFFFFWRGGYFERKYTSLNTKFINQKIGDFIDVVYAFDVPQVHVSDSLSEPMTWRKNIRTKPNSAKKMAKRYENTLI